MMYLAETTLTIAEIGTLIGTVLIALLGAGWIGKRNGENSVIRITPQPLPISMVEKLATKQELGEVEERIQAGIIDLKKCFDTNRAEVKKETDNLHHRINNRSRDEAATQSQIGQLAGQIAQMNQSITTLLSVSLHPAQGRQTKSS